MSENTYLIKCIERAAKFMAAEVEAERAPDLEAIAKAAGLSKFHFHRLYSLATGETCQQTLTRLRLARAASALKDPDMSITEAALAAGYGSSQAFAKSFKRLLDQSATSARTDPDRLTQAVETLSVPKDSAGEAQPALRVELASLEPFAIITKRTEGTYPALNAVYWALFEAAGDPALVGAILGFPRGTITEPDGLVFDCGLKLASTPETLPSDMAHAECQGGLHLTTRHVGSYDSLPDAVDRLYMSCFANDSIIPADQPCVFHYVDEPEETPEDELRTDIYLPISQRV